MMAFKIDCPNCGRRDVSEFTFGATEKTPPDPGAGLREWSRYVFIAGNVLGAQEEWWRHAFGCGVWLRIKRDTADHKITEILQGR